MGETVITLEALKAWRDERLENDPGPRFNGMPEAWMEDPTWLCPNGHASDRYLKTDDGPRCLACRDRVILGPPISEVEFQTIVNNPKRVT